MTLLAERVLAGDRRAVARALTLVERGGPEARALLKTLFPYAGRSQVVGVTGAPGVGKSTLVDALALEARSKGRTVGIIAVDPSSPFTGGAILGDRIRMQDATMDPGVFMRSLASRGRTGGLSKAAIGALEVMDAAGFSLILIETVGAGQSEIEIMSLAQTVAVVMAPGLGDDIQAIKAGILEIADVFVVNKADRDGSEHTVRELRNMLHLAAEAPPWPPTILKTVATERRGLEVLLETLDQHREFLTQSGRFQQRRRQQAEAMVRQAVVDTVDRELDRLKTGLDWERQIQQLLEGRIDPDTVADWVIRHLEQKL